MVVKFTGTSTTTKITICNIIAIKQMESPYFLVRAFFMFDQLAEQSSFRLPLSNYEVSYFNFIIHGKCVFRI